MVVILQRLEMCSRLLKSRMLALSKPQRVNRTNFLNEKNKLGIIPLAPLQEEKKNFILAVYNR